MPFKSEDQRRYLWANEPEIARDWTDTYGSRIQNNTGGITRLGYANGPNYQVDPNTINQDLLGTADYQGEEEEENYLEKFMRYMQGNAGNLSQGDVTANKKFLGNMQFSPNNPYRMTSGLFQGMNAPGTSAHGSKNPKEMAQKWVEKYGGVDHQTTPMKEKKAKMRQTAGYAPHHSYSGGGISRLGYANGPPGGGDPEMKGTGQSYGDSYGPGRTPSPHEGLGNIDSFKGAPPGMSTTPTHDPTQLQSPKKNWLGTGIEGLRHIGPFLGKKAPYIKGALSIYDMWDQPLKEEDLILSADDESGDQATSPGNYSQNEVANQLFGTSFNVLDPFQQGQVNDAINTYGTTSLGTIKT